ncbi:UBP50 hydrolase, partial [Ardeotis kori]|nr:UBP50 hydrolase [Ardeotis kori]
KSVTAFGCLMSRMWLGGFDCVSPEDFLTALGMQYPTFSKNIQQDAHEFLMCVLNELHEALKVRAQLWCKRCVTDAKAGRGSVSETSIITELFEGQLSYGITCLQCNATTNRAESFTVLSLPIPSKSMCSLQNCLKCFFQQDTLTQNNQIHCSCCGTKQDAAVKSTITKAPQIIVFHLKRYRGWNLLTHLFQVQTKSDYQFLALPVVTDSFTRPWCLLQNHSGLLDDGHYTAFCKHSVTQDWYNFDDADITKIPNSSVQTDTAYLLFY